MKDGIAVKSHSVKLLFVYHFGKYLEGVLCYASDLAQNNGKVTILSGVLNLPVYQIDLSDVLYFDKFSVYKAFDLQRNVGTIKVNDPLVIVKDILSRRISWNVMRQRELRCPDKTAGYQGFLRERRTHRHYKRIGKRPPQQSHN